MNKQEYNFSFEVFDSINELNEADRTLLTAARNVTKSAYAPYSNFEVGAAAKLEDGEVLTGSNQENASYPVGLCAERVLLSAISSLRPGTGIETMAISYHNSNGDSDHPISPCGMCRQSLLEYESRFQHPIRLILGGMEGKVYVIEKASMLLPLSFTSNDLK